MNVVCKQYLAVLHAPSDQS